MIKIIFSSFTAILLMLSLSLNAQEKPGMYKLEGDYTIDGQASDFSFKVSNMGLFSAEGTMGGIQGKINFKALNSNDFVYLSLDVKTVDTGIKKRDEHLLTDDFFYAEKYPKIEFRGGQVTHVKENLYLVSGQLKMRGISRAEKIPVRLKIENKNLIFSGTVKIDRGLYEIDGGSTVGDDVQVNYQVVARSAD